METTNHLLEEFEINDLNRAAGKQLNILIVLGIIHNIFEVLFVYLVILPTSIKMKDAFTSPVIFIPLIIYRSVAIFILIKLALKKKTGWLLTFILFVYNILLKIPRYGIRINTLNIKVIIQLMNIADFLISAIIIYILSSKAVREFFKISKRNLYTCLIAGLLYYAIIRFLVNPLLLSFVTGAKL